MNKMKMKASIFKSISILFENIDRRFFSNFTSPINKEISIEDCIARGNNIFFQSRHKSYKRFLDFSNVPKINEDELEEQNVRGWGPGGQATNKTNNAVVLKHIPTGIVVRCHETRSLWENKKRAREIMVTKLDNLLNNERSVKAQIQIIEKKRSVKKRQKQKKLSELKKAFKQSEEHKTIES